MEAEFYQVVSQQKCRKPEEYRSWIKKFFQVLEEESFEPPRYLGDPRVVLLFRKHSENKTHLNLRERTFRLINSLQLWYSIFKKEMKDEYLDLDPRDLIEVHDWSKRLIDQEKKYHLKQTEVLHQLIDEASSQGEGLFACPECHSRKFVKSHTEQRARSDEGMTTVNMCTDCKKKWTIRG